MQRIGIWPTRCIFCDREQITEEHVFARKWIRGLLPGTGGRSVAGQADRGQQERVERVYRSHDVDVIARCVCNTCNSGWMNHLDQRAQPVMAPLVKSLATHLLSPDEQRLLARWAMKIAVVLDYAVTLTDDPCADPRPLGVIDASVHKRLVRDELPPEDTHIWLAAGRETEPLIRSLTGGAQAPQPTFHGVPLLGKKRPKLYAVTFRVNHAVFQAFVPDPGSGWLPGNDFDEFVIQLWPPTFKALSWPPTKIFETDGAVKAFHEARGFGPLPPP